MAGGINFSRTEKIVYDMAVPLADDMGLYIYDVEYVKEGSTRFLRIYVDINSEDKRISLDECEEFSRAFSEVIDKADPISENYFLEVSSPGIERKIRLREHFEMNKGCMVDVGLYKAVDGLKTIVGELVGLDSDENVVISVGGEEKKISLKQTTTINVHFEF